jgi:hypothetical protein
MTTPDNLTLKPYLETIATHCASLNKEELLEIIMRLAKTISPEARLNFLHTILPEDNRAADLAATPGEDKLLEEIRQLQEDVDERISSIEDGSYYDRHDTWEEPDDEEGPDYFSEEQKQALETLFSQVSNLFLSNQIATAKEGFAELFNFPLEHTILNINLREPRARYCRCIYETTPTERRVQELLTAIAPEGSLGLTHQSLLAGEYPFLQDVINARPDELPDFDQFLPAWQQALADFQTDRAAILCLEANYLSNGLEGVATLARQWKDRQPYGYLFWLEKLFDQANWQEIATVCQEALYALSYSERRAKVADSLIYAADKLKDLPLLLKGKREQCLSLPNEYFLLQWLNEAEAQGKKTEELTIALTFLAKKSRLVSLYAKTCLIAGELEKAFTLAKEEKSYGWSYSSAGVVFAGLLTALLPPNTPPPRCIRNLLEHYVEKSAYPYRAEATLPTGKRMIDQVLQGLRSKEYTPAERTQYLEWAENLGKGRIEHIVNNKFRKAYGRAAEVLGALAEYFILTDHQEHALSLITHYRDVQFTRYPAFKSEVNQVIASSNLLTKLTPKKR